MKGRTPGGALSVGGGASVGASVVGEEIGDGEGGRGEQCGVGLQE